jgi:CheY-like chemotaxis protein
VREGGKISGGKSAEGRAFRGRGAKARRVLCVEDSPYGRVVLNTILREFGDRVDFVPSGEAAINALKSGIFDIVLMDVTLNGADGFAVTRQIREMPKPAGEIPIIGISARSHAESEAKSAGMDAYLSKPVSPAALAETMARLTRI